MSDGYYGPYQSRILNFISKQSRQVADNCDRTWRQIKQTTLSSTQILLYPAYLLVQSSRMLTRQLRESSPKVDLPELQKDVGDENPDLLQNWDEGETSESSIGKILHLAENLLNPSQTAKTLASAPLLINQTNPATEKPARGLLPAINFFSGKTTKHQTTSALEHPLAKTQLDSKPKVSAIATFIPARTLVLVGRENQVLDILTPQQQELLENRITWEVANSGPERRHIAQKELKFNLGLELAAKKSQLAPVRRFWELMAWLQTSPVAVKRNQFGESIFAVKKSIDRNAILLQKATAQVAAATTALQQSIAQSHSTDDNRPKLETYFNNKLDRSPNPLSFVTLLDRAALNLEEFTVPPAAKTTAANPEVKLDTSVAPTNLGLTAREILEKYAQNIEKMIWSSVDHLLGKETAASDSTEKSVAIRYYLQQPGQLEKTENSQEVDRPWLNWQDLFGEPGPPQSIEGSSEPDGATDEISISQNSSKVKEEMAEGRSTAVSMSPYPKSIHRLLAGLKQSLLAPESKSQPQKASNLAVTQKNSPAPATPSTPGGKQETQVPKYTNPNTAPNSQSPAAITQQTSKYTPTATAAKPTNRSATVPPADEYLETKSQSMGYIKHPLEQVLEWIDLLMVRLENILEQLWNWAKTNWPTILQTKDKIE
ncbi:hypothetical protein IQ269_10630 [Tychonema sp. LEGE 07199]|uniref:hypothetical protein n=1 Tax=unclassified Tychonema TaxID=2642144 RepID=UPI00188098DA|nr:MULTISPECIES: hypothetical protein [unclassified Tychonema]MBE9121242.1 hypothetical protein [Tychonema sp. LEGE 07199]MBE9131682.1 hypothetical protein [Tychonema sp. LEGE 07196]